MTAPAPGEVHVWSASLDRPASQTAALAAALSDKERVVADRHVFEQSRQRTIASRGLLRAILGMYLARDPRAVELATGAYGKPYLPDGALTFNVAHSDDRALYAVGRARTLGVDIERLRPVASSLALAARFFAPSERDALMRAVPERRDDAFLRLWTRKEAYLKARGDGLTAGLARFEVSADEDQATLRPLGDAGDADGWTIYHLAPLAGYVGALVVQGGPVAVRLVEWRW